MGKGFVSGKSPGIMGLHQLVGESSVACTIKLYRFHFYSKWEKSRKTLWRSTIKLFYLKLGVNFRPRHIDIRWIIRRMHLTNDSLNVNVFYEWFVEVVSWVSINVSRSSTVIEFVLNCLRYLWKEHWSKVESHYWSKVPHLEWKKAVKKFLVW